MVQRAQLASRTKPVNSFMLSEIDLIKVLLTPDNAHEVFNVPPFIKNICVMANEGCKEEM